MTPWDKITMQDLMVASGSAIGSSTVANVAIFSINNIAFKVWCLSWFSMFVLNFNAICFIRFTMYHVSTLQKIQSRLEILHLKGSGFDEK